LYSMNVAAQEKDRKTSSGDPPVIVEKPKAQVVDEGEMVSFRCKLTAQPRPEVRPITVCVDDVVTISRFIIIVVIINIIII